MQTHCLFRDHTKSSCQVQDRKSNCSKNHLRDHMVPKTWSHNAFVSKPHEYQVCSQEESSSDEETRWRTNSDVRIRSRTRRNSCESDESWWVSNDVSGQNVMRLLLHRARVNIHEPTPRTLSRELVALINRLGLWRKHACTFFSHDTSCEIGVSIHYELKRSPTWASVRVLHDALQKTTLFGEREVDGQRGRGIWRGLEEMCRIQIFSRTTAAHATATSTSARSEQCFSDTGSESFSSALRGGRRTTISFCHLRSDRWFSSSVGCGVVVRTDYLSNRLHNTICAVCFLFLFVVFPLFSSCSLLTPCFWRVIFGWKMFRLCFAPSRRKIAVHGEKDAPTWRRQQDRGKVKADDDELGLLCFDKFFDCEHSDCVEKPGDTQSTLSNRLVKYRKLDAGDRNRDAASSFQLWQKDTFSGRKYSEICRPRRSRISRKLRRFGIRRQWRRLATQSPYFQNYVLHMEKVFSIMRQIWSQSDGSNERLRCEHSDMVYNHVCHTSSCSSSREKYTENLRSPKNQPLKSLRQFFEVTGKLITD